MVKLMERLVLQSSSSTPAFPSLEFCVSGSAARDEAERFVAGVFQISYGAQLTEFMPLLVSFRQSGHLTSALGLRSALGSRLFCEKYLDEPAETQVQKVFGRRVPRDRILEMGNLVASDPGHAALLYTLVGFAMYAAGIDYVLFTANRAVRISLRRSRLTSVPIAAADRQRLKNHKDDWGSYYNGKPMVMLGDVRSAMESCTANPLVGSVLGFYQPTINELVAAIQSKLK